MSSRGRYDPYDPLGGRAYDPFEPSPWQPPYHQPAPPWPPPSYGYLPFREALSPQHQSPVKLVRSSLDLGPFRAPELKIGDEVAFTRVPDIPFRGEHLIVDQAEILSLVSLTIGNEEQLARPGNPKGPISASVLPHLPLNLATAHVSQMICAKFKVVRASILSHPVAVQAYLTGLAVV